MTQACDPTGSTRQAVSAKYDCFSAKYDCFVFHHNLFLATGGCRVSRSRGAWRKGGVAQVFHHREQLKIGSDRVDPKLDRIILKYLTPSVSLTLDQQTVELGGSSST